MVTGSHVPGKSGNISETVQHKDIATTDQCDGISNRAISDNL